MWSKSYFLRETQEHARYFESKSIVFLSKYMYSFIFFERIYFEGESREGRREGSPSKDSFSLSSVGGVA